METRSTVSAIEEKMDAWIVNMRNDQKKMMAWQETMHACLDSKEPNLEETQSEAEHREVPKEHATVETAKASNKRHMGRNLAVEHHQKSKDRTWENWDPRRNWSLLAKR
jgi:hypothetical protein